MANFLKEMTEFVRTTVNLNLSVGATRLKVGDNLHRGALQNGQSVRDGCFVLRELTPAFLSKDGANIVEKPISFQCCCNSYDSFQEHRDLLFKLLTNENGSGIELPNFEIQSVTGTDFAFVGNTDLGMNFVMNLVFRYKRLTT